MMSIIVIAKANVTLLPPFIMSHVNKHSKEDEPGGLTRYLPAFLIKVVMSHLERFASQ